MKRGIRNLKQLILLATGVFAIGYMVYAAFKFGEPKFLLVPALILASFVMTIFF